MRPYSLFQKFLSRPYTRYSPEKGKKKSRVKNAEVQTEKENVNIIPKIEPPRQQFIPVNQPQQFLVPNNVVFHQNQGYQQPFYQQPLYQYHQ